MNHLHFLAMVHGHVAVPDDLRSVVADARNALGLDLDLDQGQASMWQAKHATGKRCGHRHNDKAKAAKCACRLGEGWNVEPISNQSGKDEW